MWRLRPGVSVTQSQLRNLHRLAESVALISAAGGQARVYLNPADYFHFRIDFYPFLCRRKKTFKERHQDIVGGIWDAVIARHSQVPRGKLVVTNYMAGLEPLPTSLDTIVILDTSEWGLKKI
jgi:hypothetical protein